MTQKLLPLTSAFLVLIPLLGRAALQTDAEIISQIKAADPVIKALFSECTEERLIKKIQKNGEFFTYTAKCTLKNPLDACEREQIKIYGDFEGSWAPYNTQLHLLCQD